MTQSIEAIYENGVFKPTKPVEMQDGQQVQLTVSIKPPPSTGEERLRVAHEMQEAFADWTDADWAEFEAGFRRGTR